ncbi:MAG: hypothetical protein ACLPWF_20770 [Bryobacteraceae bacterium]
MRSSKATFPLLGTWKITKGESSRPELPHPVSGSTTFAQEDDAIHYSTDGVWSGGRTSHVSAILRLDGNWSPLTGSLVADALSFRPLADGSFEARMRKGDLDVGTGRFTVSADGRTMTGSWEFFGARGTVTWKTTSERQ